LLKFRDGQLAFESEFRAALKDAQGEAATRCAHTLKGTAGNIGAKALYDAASALEQACKGHAAEAQIEVLLQAVLAQLNPVLQGLQGLTGEKRAGEEGARHAAPSVRGLPDSVDVQSALGRLAELLQHNDAEASDVLDQLEIQVAGTPLAAGLAPVAQALAEFDFDNALLRLNALRS